MTCNLNLRWTRMYNLSSLGSSNLLNEVQSRSCVPSRSGIVSRCPDLVTRRSHKIRLRIRRRNCLYRGWRIEKEKGEIERFPLYLYSYLYRDTPTGTTDPFERSGPVSDNESLTDYSKSTF